MGSKGPRQQWRGRGEDLRGPDSAGKEEGGSEQDLKGQDNKGGGEEGGPKWQDCRERMGWDGMGGGTRVRRCGQGREGV